jgi:hypothetical protein
MCVMHAARLMSRNHRDIERVPGLVTECWEWSPSPRTAPYCRSLAVLTDEYLAGGLFFNAVSGALACGLLLIGIHLVIHAFEI